MERILSTNHPMLKNTLHPILLTCLALMASFHSAGQVTDPMYRIAKIKVDAKHLEEYKKALREQMESAVKSEPGVLSYTAVADRKDPSMITIFEVYADRQAYESHISTSHFRKYKETVKDWVLSLELMDTELVLRAGKEGF